MSAQASELSSTIGTGAFQNRFRTGRRRTVRDRYPQTIFRPARLRNGCKTADFSLALDLRFWFPPHSAMLDQRGANYTAASILIVPTARTTSFGWRMSWRKLGGSLLRKPG
jgi:hypothetical protein